MNTSKVVVYRDSPTGDAPNYRSFFLALVKNNVAGMWTKNSRFTCSVCGTTFVTPDHDESPVVECHGCGDMHCCLKMKKCGSCGDVEICAKYDQCLDCRAELAKS